MHVGNYFEALPLRQTLTNFKELAEEAESEELQCLLRTVVHRIEWMPDGEHWVGLYHQPVPRHGERYTWITD